MATASSSPVQPSSPDPKMETASSSPVQPSSPDPKMETASSSPVQPSSPDPKMATASSSPVQPSSPDPKMATASSSPVQPSSPDPKMETASSSPVQPSSPDPKMETASSSPVQPSSPDPKMATASSSPVQPSSPDPKMATASSSPVQPSSPDPKMETASSSPVQPSSPDPKMATASSSPVQPSACHASTSVMSSSQVSETLSLREMHLRPSRKREYSGSALDDSDISDYSDVDYIPQISSDESDGSASEHDIPESSSEAGGSSERCMTTPSSNRMKGQTKETDTSPDKRTFVQAMPSSKKERKSYNKKQYCIYCSKPYSKLARHLKFVHRNEVEVAKAVAFIKHSKQRRVQLNLLRKKGNFAHNTHVVRKGHGEMIACYRPKKSKNTKDFIHCVYCQGLYNKHSLWKHIKNCPLKPKNDDSQGRKRVRSLCALKTPVGLEISKGFKKILSFMNYDDVSRTIHSDTCIMQLGEHMFNRMGSDVTKHDYIRQKMREVGRLLLKARKITPLRTMVEFIIPATSNMSYQL